MIAMTAVVVMIIIISMIIGMPGVRMMPVIVAIIDTARQHHKNEDHGPYQYMIEIHKITSFHCWIGALQ
jgi:hypothetical protein